ncbi:RNA polymerase sigma factor [Micromonospora sp. HM5-17]|uniref:RNA polymerase sigma factor n=1 Tax=Micromonospora sp. HM5-17 TaxID=2487710 RepID=UPI001F19FF2B|nr:RNA polymerase sigma factor [Micromonospora sp. HM5-17]
MARDRSGGGSDQGRTAMDQAMAELYHACYRRLVTQVYAFTTDLTEAQDVVQEAFARAIARPRGLTDVDNPEAWLRTVAVNVVRRRWRRRQLLDAILLRDRPVSRLVEAAPGPERTDLREALAGLPVGYREVIVLHYLADLPVEEVATLLGVPVGTVKSRLSRGRAALAALLGDYHGRDGTPGSLDRTDPTPVGPAAKTGPAPPSAAARGHATADDSAPGRRPVAPTGPAARTRPAVRPG